jgi:hypothetical protein
MRYTGRMALTSRNPPLCKVEFVWRSINKFTHLQSIRGYCMSFQTVYSRERALCKREHE